MNRTCLTLSSALALLFASAMASAQSTNAQVIIGVTNEAFSAETFLGLPSLYSEERTTPFAQGLTAGVSGSAGRSFTGMGRDNGDSRTMDFSASGQGSAGYGRLRTYNSLTVENAFYSESNAPYFNTQTDELNPDGVPDFFDSFARAQFTDILQYGGTLPGYQARYLFRVHGLTQGNAEMSSVVTFDSMGRDDRFDFRYDASTNPVEHTEIVSSSYYPVSGGTPQEFTVRFATAVTGRTQLFDDGATIFGETDFLSTATLERIEMVDAAGNPVGGWSVTSASGTVYAQAVPEPASLAALAIGGLVWTRRRKK